MTNLITESTSNIINELLDDIKENIIQINDSCRFSTNPLVRTIKRFAFYFVFSRTNSIEFC